MKARVLIVSWNHSDAYSCIGYISGYLRYYYPLEFLTAAFNIFTGKEDKIIAITEYANKIGVKISPPKFRHSRSGYQMDKENDLIYKGLESIKFMNADVSERLYQMRGQHFDSFVDVIKVFPGDSRQLDILCKLSYFSEFGSIGTLLRTVEMYNLYGGKKVLKKGKVCLPTDLLSKYCTETEKQWRVQDPDGFIKELCDMIPKDCRVPLMSEIRWQQEYLGYCSIIMPEQKDVGYVMNVDCKYSPKITMYLLDKSATVTYKLSKAVYQKQPFDTGDFIQVRTEQRNKSRKTENGWEKVPNEYDTWITAYIIKNNL